MTDVDARAVLVATDKTMRCAYCNRAVSLKDGFPNTIFAQCWPCFWKAHKETDHPRPWWKGWRLRAPLFRREGS